jgi:hypothetical protein
MDLTQAILYAQLVNAAYAIPTDDVTNHAGQPIPAGAGYTVITSIFANDLATDMNPDRGKARVSIGLILQSATGDVVIAIRGTEGIQEWIHDAEFLMVPTPFLAGAGHTDDGFTAMYLSMTTTTDLGSGSTPVTKALPTLAFPRPVTSLTICGHSLGASLATLLALDVAANTPFKNPIVYTYASPRTGGPRFAATYNQVVPNTTRIAGRLDLVPKLPLPPLYDHVLGLYELNSIQLGIPPRILVKPDLVCLHILTSYLYLLSLLAGGPVLPLQPQCIP